MGISPVIGGYTPAISLSGCSVTRWLLRGKREVDSARLCKARERLPETLEMDHDARRLREDGAHRLLCAAMRQEVADLDYRAAIGEYALRRALRRNRELPDLSRREIIALLDLPDWFASPQCARWCELIGVDHAGLLAAVRKQCGSKPRSAGAGTLQRAS